MHVVSIIIILKKSFISGSVLSTTFPPIYLKCQTHCMKRKLIIFSSPLGQILFPNSAGKQEIMTLSGYHGRKAVINLMMWD